MSTGKAQVFGADARFSQGRRAAGGACTGRARARRARRGGEGLMRMVCKPGSVRGALPPSMAIHLGPCLRRGSCCLPGPRAKAALRIPRARSLFGIAPGGACRASPVARPAVGSCPTVSPLPGRNGRAVCFLWRFPSGCPGRVLPGTLALWSPDFPHAPKTGARGHPTIRIAAEISAAAPWRKG